MTDATAREQAREALVKALDAADKPDVMLRAFARDESIHGVLGQGAIDYLDANPAAKAALAAWSDAETRELMADAVTGAATVGMHFPALNLALGIPDTAMQAIDQSRRDWYERATAALATPAEAPTGGETPCVSCFADPHDIDYHDHHWHGDSGDPYIGPSHEEAAATGVAAAPLSDEGLSDWELVAEAWANVMDGRRIVSPLPGVPAARINGTTTTGEDWHAIRDEYLRLKGAPGDGRE